MMRALGVAASHGSSSSVDTTPSGVFTIHPTDSVHVPRNLLPSLCSVNSDKGCEGPDIGTTQELAFIGHDGSQCLDRCEQTKVVSVVQIDTAIAASDAVMKDETEKLGSQVGAAVNDTTNL